MKFMLLVCWDAAAQDGEPDPTPAELAAAEAEGMPWADDLQARGVRLDGDRLAPPRRARSVQVRGGRTLVTEGAFAETKEAVGGYDVIECGSLEEALDIAAAHPVAAVGTIEVRPFYGG